MSEVFLHYIWKFLLFNQRDLRLTSGDAIQIIRQGELNKDAGPDFFNSIVSIEGTKWAGNVELHLNASDWLRHGHQNDPAYDNIILHVVWKNDQVIFRSNGTKIPTLELKGLVSKNLLDNYSSLFKESESIPCASVIEGLDPVVIDFQLDRMGIERLESKSKRILQLLEHTKGDWEETFYQLLGKYFGFKVNAIPFELLATSLSFQIVRKHRSNFQELESLFFGQAGMLGEDFKGNYANELKSTYDFLQRKYGLKPIPHSIWKFSRLRPTNFPTIRIAQFTYLWSQHENLFQKVLNAKNMRQLKKLFSIEVSTYWESHFRFEVPSVKRTKKSMGEQSINGLLINSVIPLVFTYGEATGNLMFKEQALSWLEKLPAEQNRIIRQWGEYGVTPKNASESQSLIQLKTSHCANKNCLNCAIGNAVIKQ